MQMPSIKLGKSIINTNVVGPSYAQFSSPPSSTSTSTSIPGHSTMQQQQYVNAYPAYPVHSHPLYNNNGNGMYLQPHHDNLQQQSSSRQSLSTLNNSSSSSLSRASSSPFHSGMQSTSMLHNGVPLHVNVNVNVNGQPYSTFIMNNNNNVTMQRSQTVQPTPTHHQKPTSISLSSSSSPSPSISSGGAGVDIKSRRSNSLDGNIHSYSNTNNEYQYQYHQHVYLHTNNAPGYNIPHAFTTRSIPNINKLKHNINTTNNTTTNPTNSTQQSTSQSQQPKQQTAKVNNIQLISSRTLSTLPIPRRSIGDIQRETSTRRLSEDSIGSIEYHYYNTPTPTPTSTNQTIPITPPQSPPLQLDPTWDTYPPTTTLLKLGSQELDFTNHEKPTLFELLKPHVLKQGDGYVKEFEPFQNVTGWFLGSFEEAMSHYAFWRPAARGYQFANPKLLSIPRLDVKSNVLRPGSIPPQSSTLSTSTSQQQQQQQQQQSEQSDQPQHPNSNPSNANLPTQAQPQQPQQQSTKQSTITSQSSIFPGVKILTGTTNPPTPTNPSTTPTPNPKTHDYTTPILSASDTRNTPQEADVLRLVTAASRIPSKVTPDLKMKVIRGWGEDGLQSVACISAFIGWTNAITDAVGMELGVNDLLFGQEQLGGFGWRGDRHMPRGFPPSYDVADLSPDMVLQSMKDE
ncbi:hypothetical protein HDU76_008082, partial [Blyttiomyces sp. JEL0837]